MNTKNEDSSGTKSALNAGWVKSKSDVFRVVTCHFELIFSLLTIPKCDFVEFEEAMFQGLEWHSQLIFGLWTS